MNIDPRQLRYRVEIFRPTNTKTATGNTKGEYLSYASRYAGREEQAGSDSVHNDQNTATNTVTWVIRYDANVKPSWVLRHDNDSYYIQAVEDADSGKKAYLKLKAVKRESINLSTASLTAPVLSLGDTGSTTQALTWTASSGEPTGYRVYVDGTLFATVPGISLVVAGLTPETEYTYYVDAYDLYSESDNSNEVAATTNALGATGFFGTYFG